MSLSQPYITIQVLNHLGSLRVFDQNVQHLDALPDEVSRGSSLLQHIFNHVVKLALVQDTEDEFSVDLVTRPLLDRRKFH